MTADPRINQALFDYCLRLGDTSLILGHRLSEWTGKGPFLEEDIAMTNIALDLIGMARNWLTYAGEAEGKGRSEDDLAYFRHVFEFRNFMLVEQPNGDFGKTMMRQFLHDVYAYLLYEKLQQSADPTVAAIVLKSHKEIVYHLRHCTEWIKRLGDGTEESHQRVQHALNDLWMYTGELFDMNETDTLLIDNAIAVDLKTIRQPWFNMVSEIFDEVGLKIPPAAETYVASGSINGIHTEHLGYLLAEMQFLPRAYPEANW